MGLQYPALEVAAHGAAVGRQGGVQPADAADQGDQRGQFGDGVVTLVVIQMGVGLPYPQRGEFGAFLAQGVQQFGYLAVGHFAAPGRGVEVDVQCLYLVGVLLCLFLQPGGKLFGQCFSVFFGFTSPADVDYRIQVVMDDGLFLVPADAVDQLDQFAVEYAGGLFDQFGLGLVAGIVAGVAAAGQAADFQCLLFHPVGVDGAKQFADHQQQRFAISLFSNAGAILVVQLLVQPRQPSGEGGYSIRITRAHHHAHSEILEGDAGRGDQRLAGGLQGFGHADGIHDHIVGLGALGRGGHLLQAVLVQGAGAAAFHLLEVVAAFHVAHEQQAFQRFDVGAGGDHVHGNGDARVVVVAELRQHGFGIFSNPVGNLLAELVAFAKLLAHGVDDVVGVAVGLGEDQGFGYFLPARKDSRQAVAEGADDRTDLIRVDDIPVELFAGIGLILILGFPALLARLPLAPLYLLLGGDHAALFSFFGFNHKNFIADVDAVGHGFFVVILADHVFAKEAVGTVVRGGGQAHQVGIEVFNHLPPEVVDGAVAFVDDDDVEELRRDLFVVDHRQRCFRSGELFCRVGFFQCAVQRFILEN